MSAPAGKREALIGLLSGLIFAGGLVVSGMTDPARVLGFLDFAGDWDPRLIGVMVGAIGVHFTWLRIASRREGPAALAYSLPPSAKVDRPLLLGAVVFGLGWGLAGYCPGPALVSAGGGVASAAIFTAAMLGGMWLFKVSSVAVGGGQRARPWRWLHAQEANVGQAVRFGHEPTSDAAGERVDA